MKSLVFPAAILSLLLASQPIVANELLSRRLDLLANRDLHIGREVRAVLATLDTPERLTRFKAQCHDWRRDSLDEIYSYVVYDAKVTIIKGHRLIESTLDLPENELDWTDANWRDIVRALVIERCEK